MLLSKSVSMLPENALHRLGHQPWTQLLQSGGLGHENARFDILVADPIATLETHGTITHCNDQGVISVSHTDPFVLCQQWRTKLLGPDQPHQSDLPFTGGAVGLWGYDLGRRVENIAPLDKPILSTPDMAVGFYDWALIYDHHNHQSHLVVNHPTPNDYWHYRYHWLLAQVEQNFVPFKLTGNWQTNLNRADYGQRFDAIHAYLHSGDCYQINLTQQFAAPYQGDPVHAYLQLTKANEAPFSAFIRLPNSVIVSVSPERFIALNDRHIETKPIKGTRPRSNQPDLDAAAALELQYAEKDRAENLMIVDLLRNDIGRVSSPGSVAVPKLFAIESFPAVHHLVSTVTGQLARGLVAEDLLRACFPGGSITGAPKVRAMQIIEELEPHRRNAYCGSIGYIDSRGNMDSNIAIRTLVCENQTVYAWAGGGIVADSDADAEYQECLDKLSRILPALR
jgi:para-aminobenzoate synthetase component 1